MADDQIEPINATIAWLWSKDGQEYEDAATIIKTLRDELDREKLLATTNALVVQTLMAQVEPLQKFVLDLSKKPCERLPLGKSQCWFIDLLPEKTKHESLAMCPTCRARYLATSMNFVLPVKT